MTNGQKMTNESCSSGKGRIKKKKEEKIRRKTKKRQVPTSYGVWRWSTEDGVEHAHSFDGPFIIAFSVELGSSWSTVARYGLDGGGRDDDKRGGWDMRMKTGHRHVVSCYFSLLSLCPLVLLSSCCLVLLSTISYSACSRWTSFDFLFVIVADLVQSR